jgi:hypothetical protein
LFVAGEARAQAPADKAAGKPAQPAAAGAPEGMDPKKAAEMQKMMAAWQKFATPGPEHQQLKAMSGTWTAAVKMYMDPKAPPQESTGTTNNKMILGDRYLLQDYSGTMMGQPFNGWSISGFDNGRKKWLTFWIDSVGTGFLTGEGTADKTGKVITYQTQGTDPMTNKTVKGRQILRIESDSRIVFEMYEKKGGKEMKLLEIVYTKK